MAKKGNTKLGQALIKSLEEALEWTKGNKKLRVTERRLEKAHKHTDNLPEEWFGDETMETEISTVVDGHGSKTEGQD